MDEKPFTLSRADRDLLFEVLASERTGLARDLGNLNRRLGEDREDPFARALLTFTANRWDNVSRLMRLFGDEE